jgi:uncharacterized membrane protein YphA (DoxX/SURF4 family)
MSRARRPVPSKRSAAPGRPAAPPRSPARPAHPAHPAVRLASTAGRAATASRLAADWAPAVAGVLLGLVLAWFGYHELVQPALWTGYVPVLASTSSLAVILVLAHGWVLLVLAVALIAGIAPRAAAMVAAILLLEIIVSLIVTGGLSDLTLRDVGVLGLALSLTGSTRQRLILRR